MCPTCREKLRSEVRRSAEGTKADTLCFECYRTDLARERAVKAIVRKLTQSGGVGAAQWEARIQEQLPFEPINHARLARLRAERAGARAAMKVGAPRFVDRRRHAQIAARQALQRIVQQLQSPESKPASPGRREEADARRRDLQHAAELQLPDAWLPFVASR